MRCDWMQKNERKDPARIRRPKNEALPEIEGKVIYPTIQDEMIAIAPHFTLNVAGVKVPDPISTMTRCGILSPRSRGNTFAGRM